MIGKPALSTWPRLIAIALPGLALICAPFAGLAQSADPDWSKAPTVSAFLAGCSQDFDACVGIIRNETATLGPGVACIPAGLPPGDQTRAVIDWLAARPNDQLADAADAIHLALRVLYPCG